MFWKFFSEFLFGTFYTESSPTTGFGWSGFGGGGGGRRSVDSTLTIRTPLQAYRYSFHAMPMLANTAALIITPCSTPFITHHVHVVYSSIPSNQHPCLIHVIQILYSYGAVGLSSFCFKFSHLFQVTQVQPYCSFDLFNLTELLNSPLYFLRYDVESWVVLNTLYVILSCRFTKNCINNSIEPYIKNKVLCSSLILFRKIVGDL